MSPRAARTWIVFAVALMLGACAARPPAPQPKPAPDSEPVSEKQPAEPQPAPTSEVEDTPTAPQTVAQASGAAVVALLDRAEQQRGEGRLDHAAANVERALDVEPRNPFVYHRLAALRLEQEQPEQAETLARKSNSLAPNNPHLRARNWSLIAKARRMRGDTVGASAADSRAEYYRSRTAPER